MRTDQQKIVSLRSSAQDLMDVIGGIDRDRAGCLSISMWVFNNLSSSENHSPLGRGQFNTLGDSRDLGAKLLITGFPACFRVPSLPVRWQTQNFWSVTRGQILETDSWLYHFCISSLTPFFYFFISFPLHSTNTECLLGTRYEVLEILQWMRRQRFLSWEDAGNKQKYV